MTYQSREERGHACTLTEAHHSLVEISHSVRPTQITHVKRPVLHQEIPQILDRLVKVCE